MASWSEVNLYKTFLLGRMDAEHFRADVSQIEAHIRRLGYLELSQLASYINRGVQPQYDEEGDIPVLRTVNIREGGFSDARQAFVSPTFYQENSRGQTKNQDILITSTGVGTLGRVAFNHENRPFFVDGHITIVRDLRDIAPLYVATFLQSRLGYALIERRQRGSSGQIEVYPIDIGSIPIPILPQLIQENIALLCIKAREQQQQAQALYFEAESLLLSALGLDSLDLTHQLTSEKRFREVAATGRFDAEYFQPKYQQTMLHMGQSGQSIGDVARLTQRRFKPQPNISFEYIEIGNLGSNGRAESQTILGEDAPGRAQWIVKTGDVITSTVRPIRRLSALIESEQNNCVCSSGFAVLEPQNIEPEVLLVYLRLPIICEILNLHTTASMYPAISTTDLMRIPITVPNVNIGQQIVGKVRNAQHLRQESEILLDQAKRQIEQIIVGRG